MFQVFRSILYPFQVQFLPFLNLFCSKSGKTFSCVAQLLTFFMHPFLLQSLEKNGLLTSSKRGPKTDKKMTKKGLLTFSKVSCLQKKTGKVQKKLENTVILSFGQVTLLICSLFVFNMHITRTSFL